jgi:hypothetical protein
MNNSFLLCSVLEKSSKLKESSGNDDKEKEKEKKNPKKKECKAT